MTGPRRAAREVALRMLFQVDVGKQPLEEVWDGALQQVRQQVTNPAHQAVQTAYAEVRNLLASRKKSDPELRPLRFAAQKVLRVLRKLEEDLAGVTARLVAHNGGAVVLDSTELVDHHVESATQELALITGSSRLSPESQEILRSLGNRTLKIMREQVLRHLPAALETSEFAVRLVRGTLEHQDTIDVRLANAATTWRLDRQAAVDRNILRLGAFELLYMGEMPVAVTINEAVELAKKFSTAESGRFVNGVLGALAQSSLAEEQAHQASD